MAKFYNVPEPEIYYDDFDIDERNEIWINENRDGNNVRNNIIRLYFT